MSYEVGKQRLAERYNEWRRAMLLDISNALNYEFDDQDAATFEIDSLIKYHILISGLTGLLHTRFRGEAKYHKNPCLPIIARDPERGFDTSYEIEEINRFKTSHIASNFKNIPEKSITWWMLTQHYRNYETRLLDLTRNPLIALYFACVKHQDRDGYVYVFHSTNKTSEFLNPEYSGYTDHIRDYKNLYPEDTFIYLRPSFALDRINRQEGEFLWVKNYDSLVDHGLYETDQIIPVIIKKEHKSKLLKELNDPQGINWEFLNPQMF